MSLPYLPLYVADYLLDTPDLGFCQHGAYVRLLMLAWITPGCTMPADDEWVRAKLQASPEAFDDHVKPMLSRFFKQKRGRYVNDRLKEEWDKVQGKIIARKEAGKRGGQAKARNAKENPSSKTKVLPVAKPLAKPYHSLEPDKKDSEAKASEPTARQTIWAVGRPLLENNGVDPKEAGAAIGALIRRKGDAKALAVITGMRANPPTGDYGEYIWAIINGRPQPGHDPHSPNKAARAERDAKGNLVLTPVGHAA